MFSRELEIKKSSGAFVAKGLFYLFMMLLSVFCCLSSWIFYIDDKYVKYITAIGFVAILYFTFMFVYTIYKGIKPSNAIVLTEKGIYDFTNCPGKGIFVNWENVSSVKIFGSDKAPLLGIDLYDTDILLESINKNISEELRSNIEAGLPAIVIKQSDIAPSLPQVLPAFNEFISLTRPIPTVKNAPLNHKITDETTDDSILVVADEIKPVSEIVPEEAPKSVRKAKEMEEIFILPPEPMIKSVESGLKTPFSDSIETLSKKTISKEVFSIKKNNEVTGNLTKQPPEKKADILSFPDFTFEREPAPQKGVELNITKEAPVVNSQDKKPTVRTEQPIIQPSQSTVQAVKEEAPKAKQNKEIKTLDELLAQFSVPTNKDKNSK